MEVFLLLMVDGLLGKFIECYKKLKKMTKSNKIFEIENQFYAKSKVDRISKLISHYELYKKVYSLNGDIFEFGVFKGVSLIQWASFREIFSRTSKQKIVGFDTFSKFPETKFEKDKVLRKNFINEAGLNSIKKHELKKILLDKGIRNVDLVQGNILTTLPAYLNKHKNLSIILLHIDVDIYEPTKIILDMLYDRVVDGGIVILDDYRVFPGETKAVDDFFKGKNIKIEQLSFSKKRPSFIIKK